MLSPNCFLRAVFSLGAGSPSPTHLTPYVSAKSARHRQKFSLFILCGEP